MLPTLPTLPFFRGSQFINPRYFEEVFDETWGIRFYGYFQQKRISKREHDVPISSWSIEERAFSLDTLRK